jgi:hypothetical protein
MSAVATIGRLLAPHRLSKIDRVRRGQKSDCGTAKAAGQRAIAANVSSRTFPPEPANWAKKCRYSCLLKLP